MRRTPMPAAFLLLAGTALLAAAGPGRANEAVYQRLLRSTGWVVAGQNTGTCVLVDADKKLAATNFHVVGLRPEVQVLFPRSEDGRIVAERKAYQDDLTEKGIKAKVVARDPRRDLALIRLEQLPEGVEAVAIAADRPHPGQQVHSIGNPAASDALWVYSSGTVRQVYNKSFALDGSQLVEASVVETQSPINPGDSGGPLVNDDGQLVGVISGTNRNAALVSLAIEAGELRALLRGDVKTIDRTVRAALDRLNLKYAVDDLGEFRLNYNMTGGGSHSVFVESLAESLGKARFRKVWAVAQASDRPLSADVLRKALLDNPRWKVGAWEVQRVNGKECLVFCAKVPADLDADTLHTTLRAVLEISFDMKKAVQPADAPKAAAAR